jgi:hypothetical protein
MKDNIKRIPVILGFHRSVKSSFFCDVTQRWFVVDYRCFGTPFQDQALQEEGAFWTACTLKMESIGCPARSVANYESTLRNIPEERKSRIPDSIPVETKNTTESCPFIVKQSPGFSSLLFCLTFGFQFFLGTYMWCNVSRLEYFHNKFK